MIMKYFRAWRKRRACFHHQPVGTDKAVSFIGSRHIDWGRKLYTCTSCGRTWIK